MTLTPFEVMQTASAVGELRVTYAKRPYEKVFPTEPLGCVTGKLFQPSRVQGKGFIAHVDLPEEVKKAFLELQRIYPNLVREANPLFASSVE